MTKTAQNRITRAIRQKRRELTSIREEVEDLIDYLDVLEARADDDGKPMMTHEQVVKKYGLKS